MKNLILINGTMGVGKTMTSIELQKIMPKNVFLDGDWCWNMIPFIVNEETKKMVMCNIGYLLNSFIHCSEYENIIFCWVMHEQVIINEIISKLDLSECRPYIFSLMCTETALIRRIKTDIKNGIRTEDVIEGALTRLKKYNNINSNKIDVSDISPIDAAQKIKLMIGYETKCN